MPVSSETITLAGSALIFQNTYDASVTDGYRAAIISAENYLQAHFSDPVTIHVEFDMEAFDATKFIATNAPYGFLNVSFSQFTNALTNHATTADDMLAVRGLPTFDPSGGANFFVPTAEARALGLFPLASLPPFDLKVDLNSNVIWSFGQETVGAIIHELTEGGFGRIAKLGQGDGLWAPMDLFRFTVGGVRDYSGGADGTMTGGTGADTFHAFSGAGTDVVTDFSSAEGDKVQLDAGTTYILKQVGADTVVDMGAGDQLVLKNVTLSTLPTGWIFTL
jgi:hypothetical protein